MYSPTPHGNYYIICFDPDKRPIPKGFPYYHWRDPNSIFDTEAEALKYGDEQIVLYKKRIIDRIEAEVKRLQKKAAKLANTTHKVTFVDRS